MPRFDYYRTSDAPDFVLDVQSDLLDGLSTTIVVPLYRLDRAPPRVQRLNPVFDIDGESYVLMTQFLAAVSNTELRRSSGNLRDHWDSISNAIDMLLTGF